MADLEDANTPPYTCTCAATLFQTDAARLANLGDTIGHANQARAANLVAPTTLVGFLDKLVTPAKVKARTYPEVGAATRGVEKTHPLYSYSRIQNLSSNVSHSRLRVDPTILMVHYFWVFSNRKMCMQQCRGGTCGGGA